MMQSTCSLFVVCITFITTIILLSTLSVAGYKILTFPNSAKSHVFQVLAIGQALADRGHEVTIVVSDKLPLDVQTGDVLVERYEDIDIDMEELYENITVQSLDIYHRVEDHLSTISEIGANSCRNLLLNNEPLMKRLEAAQFDLIVLEGHAFAKCFYLIAHRLHIPVVSFAIVLDALAVRVPWLPSFVPTGVDQFTDRMSFAERLKNAIVVAAIRFVRIFPDPPADLLDEYRRRYGPFESLDELAVKSLLWLVPREHVLDYPIPTMPHVVAVGGLTAKKSSAELPADIKSFVEGAPNGTVLVSFGSAASGFPTLIVEKLMNAFGRLESDGLRFVFRLKTARDVVVPRNVMIRSWIPQNDLLAHRSVVLFVTHCGNNGQYEAVFHGVPMIGFPLFGDQPYNGRRLEQKGFGVAMDLRSFSSDELVENVRRIASDSSYEERVAKASAILRDSPQSPAERASYWIEHVCRFGGEHLRSAGQDLPLYAYLMLDVLVVVQLVAVVTLACVWKAVCCLRRKCIAERRAGPSKEKVG